LYDGLIRYPQQLEMAKAYEVLPDDRDRGRTWEEMTKENGWPVRPPSKSAEEIEGSIQQQFLFFAVCVVVGLICLFAWARPRGTWVEADEASIRNSSRQVVPLESIRTIDKRKWENKGIARLHYDVDGRLREFVLDDFKYDTQAMGAILTLAETNLTADQIVGDQLEREKKAIESADESSQPESSQPKTSQQKTSQPETADQGPDDEN
jgi:hypothetical protein